MRRGLSDLVLCLALGGVLMTGASEAKEKAKTYHAVRLAHAPELDGDVAGDPAWNGVALGEGCRSLESDRPSAKQTVFRVGYTAEGLFVAVTCAEPDTDGILSDGADGDPVWQEDSIEIFLSSDFCDELQFAVNAIGSRASPVTLRKWQAAAYIGEGQWSVEICLPWPVLGAFPAKDKYWGLNVCRNIASGGDIEHSTWANVVNSFHEPFNLGFLSFDRVPKDLRREIEAHPEALPTARQWPSKTARISASWERRAPARHLWAPCGD